MAELLPQPLAAEPITIRPASTADIPELFRIERASFSDPWTARHLEEDNCLVATFAGQIAGFIIWRETCPAGKEDPAENEILNLAVEPKFRRRGVATALLERLLRRPGAYFLEVRESNKAARKLYEEIGFAAIGTRKNYYRRPSESAIVMNLKRC